MSKIEKIKTHFRENKKVYIACGVTAAATAIGTAFVLSDRGSVITKFYTKQIGVVNKNNNIEVYIEALGDPGNIVQDTVTGTVYASQGQAARGLGVTPARVSEHLSGKIDSINGHVLTRLGKAPVAA